AGTGWVGTPGDSSGLTESGGNYLLRTKDGRVLSFDASGLLQYMEEPNGNRLTLTYSGGQLTEISHKDGESLSLGYNADGRINYLTDSLGRQFEYLYDGSGEHLASVIGPGSTETTYSYNTVEGLPSDHAMTEVGFPGGTHTFYTYD